MTFKFTSNPGLKVKRQAATRPALTLCVNRSCLVLREKDVGPLSGALPGASARCCFLWGREWTSCLGGKALGGCWGYRGVPPWVWERRGEGFSVAAEEKTVTLLAL